MEIFKISRTILLSSYMVLIVLADPPSHFKATWASDSFLKVWFVLADPPSLYLGERFLPKGIDCPRGPTVALQSYLGERFLPKSGSPLSVRTFCSRCHMSPEMRALLHSLAFVSRSRRTAPSCEDPCARTARLVYPPLFIGLIVGSSAGVWSQVPAPSRNALGRPYSVGPTLTLLSQWDPTGNGVRVWFGRGR